MLYLISIVVAVVVILGFWVSRKVNLIKDGRIFAPLGSSASQKKVPIIPTKDVKGESLSHRYIEPYELKTDEEKIANNKLVVGSKVMHSKRKSLGVGIIVDVHKYDLCTVKFKTGEFSGVNINCFNEPHVAIRTFDDKEEISDKIITLKRRRPNSQISQQSTEKEKMNEKLIALKEKYQSPKSNKLQISKKDKLQVSIPDEIRGNKPVKFRLNKQKHSKDIEQPHQNFGQRKKYALKKQQQRYTATYSDAARAVGIDVEDYIKRFVDKPKQSGATLGGKGLN
jgi:hypothetical protein